MIFLCNGLGRDLITILINYSTVVGYQANYATAIRRGYIRPSRSLRYLVSVLLQSRKMFGGEREGKKDVNAILSMLCDQFEL